MTDEPTTPAALEMLRTKRGDPERIVIEMED